MPEEVVFGAQASDVIDFSQRESRKQSQDVQVAGVVGNDQMPAEISQPDFLVHSVAMERLQVGLHHDVEDDAGRSDRRRILRQVAR
ncbi:MAG: hypothetical protein ACYS8X_08155 [Planctomycetota bacterium]|jgi:hypothetical protein